MLIALFTSRRFTNTHRQNAEHPRPLESTSFNAIFIPDILVGRSTLHMCSTHHARFAASVSLVIARATQSSVVRPTSPHPLNSMSACLDLPVARDNAIYIREDTEGTYKWTSLHIQDSWDSRLRKRTDMDLNPIDIHFISNLASILELAASFVTQRCLA